MPASHEVRADYGRDTIVVYQAYAEAIAAPAVAQQRFVPPFSFGRMTWIKPSFLWMMERSNWGRKPGQEHVLAVRITRAGWEEALSQAVLTSPERRVYADSEQWRRQFETSRVHVQWDPERSLRGEKLAHRSIQVGLSRHIIEKYVRDWTVEIKDCTPLVRTLYAMINSGNAAKAKGMLPKEKIYPVTTDIAKRIGLS